MKVYYIVILMLICFVSGYGQINQAEYELKLFASQYDLETKTNNAVSIIETNPAEVFIAKQYIKRRLGSLSEIMRRLTFGNYNYSDVAVYHDTAFSQILRDVSLYSDYKVDFYSYNMQFESDELPDGAKSPGQPCVNIDFENGTWSGWDPQVGEACTNGDDCIRSIGAGTGNSCDGFSLFGSCTGSFVPRHEVVGGGNDPNVGALSRLNPFNGNQSLRLGNWAGGSEAERISHTFLVPPTRTLYQYAFAVVLEDPSGHSSEEKPFFKIEFLDQNGATINSCGDYFVVAGGSVDGFQNSNGVMWKDWARVAVDLSAYVNQDVTVRFTTSDCTQGGHYGYAYLDGECTFPTINLVPQCDGSLNLEAPEGFQDYLWSDGSTNQVLNVTANGNYSVQVTSESGCIFNVDTTVTVSTPMTMNFTFEPISCNGANDGEVTINAVGGETPYEYSIDGGTTWYLTNTFTSLSGGTYDIQVKEARGCVESVQQPIIEPDPVYFSVDVTDISCFGAADGEIIVNASGGTPAYQYSIDNGSTFLNTNVFDALSQGNYNVVVRDDNRCEFAALEIIDEPTRLSIQATPDGCYDGPADLAANAFGGTSPYVYQWSNNGNAVASTKQTQVNPSVDVIYTVNVTDANGCTATATSEVKIAPRAIPNVDITEGCEDLSVVFSNNSFYQTAQSCIWTFGDGVVTDDCSNSVPHVYTDPGLYTVRLTIIDDNGCISDSITQDWINVFTQPIAAFEASPYETTTIDTEVDFYNYSINGTVYNWDIAGIETLTDVDFTYEFPFDEGDEYDVCLEVTSADGCVDQICKEIVIKDEFLDFTPNVFTPDGDNVNDVFKPMIDGISPANYELIIYDRWGQIVFTTTDYEASWDGTYKNMPAVQDAYVWKIKAQFLANSEIKEIIGHVILTR